MIIDMHSHSVFSDDARATVEQYLKWITKVVRRKHRLDGIVLTEHRGFNGEADYSALEEEYRIKVFKASELDTNRGHILVYGVNEHLLSRFDFSDVNIDAGELIREARASGAIAVPAHPGRRRIGLCEFLGREGDIHGVEVVEVLNGGSTPSENQRAQELAADRNYRSIGGSDAHFVSGIGKFATDFENSIQSIEDLVAELRNGAFEPVRLDDTTAGA
ncbi:MAG: PHP-associated domain-containing protein [Dehalococcoidia bacterium]